MIVAEVQKWGKISRLKTFGVKTLGMTFQRKGGNKRTFNTRGEKKNMEISSYVE